jgi:hypothetical protein
MLISLYTFENIGCLSCPLLSDLMFDFLLMLTMMFVFLSLLMN